MSIEKLSNVIEWRKMPPPEFGKYYLFWFTGNPEEHWIGWAQWTPRGAYRHDGWKIQAWAKMPTRATEDLLRQAYRRGYADGTAACDDDGIGTWPEPERVESALAKLKVDA